MSPRKLIFPVMLRKAMHMMLYLTGKVRDPQGCSVSSSADYTLLRQWSQYTTTVPLMRGHTVAGKQRVKKYNNPHLGFPSPYSTAFRTPSLIRSDITRLRGSHSNAVLPSLPYHMFWFRRDQGLAAHVLWCRLQQLPLIRTSAGLASNPV